MDLDQIRDAFRNPHDVHEPLTSLVMLENTHSDSMAQPLPADYVADVGRVAHEGGVPLHVDGARIFNASVALRHSRARAPGGGGLGQLLPVEGPRLSGRLDSSSAQRS